MVGILLSAAGWGEWMSFDALAKIRSGPIPNEAIIITMDETAYADPELNKGYEYPKFNRATHAKFLDKLKADGAKLVVFDIFFKNGQPEDAALAEAIRNHGNVVIAAGGLEQLSPEFAGFHTNDPAKAFVDLPGCRIGLPEVEKDVVRTFPLETDYRPSLARAAAEGWGVAVNPFPKSERWVGYYGDRGQLPTETYRDALGHPAGYYRDRAVFIGGKPKIKFLSEPSDEFNTPLTRWSGEKMRGVEIHATMFLNLIRHEWLTRLGRWRESGMILLVGILFGWLCTFFRPAPGLILVPLGIAAISGAAIFLFATQRLWFNWLVIGWVEIPAAWATSAVIYSRTLFREKQSLQLELDSIKSAHASAATIVTMPQSQLPAVSAAVALANLQPITIKDGLVAIPDFELLIKIGEGAYGEVWLARNLVGTFRAIKILYRKNFSEQRPFEREFEGVRNFESISRAHQGWVPILHVGKNEGRGFFYYVMDPADDLKSGQNINPAAYTPKTLGKLLIEKQYLSIEQCIELGIVVADALAALSGHKLVHRDIKPSNIIFANNKPRLADIGLVAHVDQSRSVVGTEGFIPPEGPGTPRADIFSLGRLLYMTATGCAPDRHPELPTSLDARNDARDLMRLMEIINKACARNQAERFETAAQLHDDLVKLRSRLKEGRT